MVRYTSLLPGTADPASIEEATPLPPFAPKTLAFINMVSRKLLTKGSLTTYPELVALGYWMRQANLARLQNRFERSAGEILFQPRGTAFHIAPSNVDSIFIYSWFLSMICGNKNIIRLSSRESQQVNALIAVLAELFQDEEWRPIAERVLLIRYDHDAELTAYFSSLCDVRIIWGGNATVSEVRRISLPPLATEVAFANKFSMALVNAENWNEATDSKKWDWLGKFYNDAYWFAQMACSSPRLIIWHGDSNSVKIAQESFWSGVTTLVKKKKTNLMPVDYINKIVAADLSALEVPDVLIRKGKLADVLRVEVGFEHLRSLLDAHLHCGAGLFYESAIRSLESLLPMLDRRIQTVSYAGYDDVSEIRNFVAGHTLRGIDRIVPFGQALEFSPYWDGHDLFRVFLRQVEVS